MEEVVSDSARAFASGSFRRVHARTSWYASGRRSVERILLCSGKDLLRTGRPCPQDLRPRQGRGGSAGTALPVVPTRSSATQLAALLAESRAPYCGCRKSRSNMGAWRLPAATSYGDTELDGRFASSGVYATGVGEPGHRLGSTVASSLEQRSLLDRVRLAPNLEALNASRPQARSGSIRRQGLCVIPEQRRTSNVRSK